MNNNKNNNILYNRPKFSILSDIQIEKLHLATLQILEKTGVAIDAPEAIDILGQAGANISDTNRVKIPSFLVEQALKTAPKSITLYTQDGEPAIVANGHTGAHFSAVVDFPDLLDPYTGKIRKTYVEDIADTSRLIDALPNMEWGFTTSNKALPPSLCNEVALLQFVLNCSKPIFVCAIGDVESLRRMIDICTIIAGGEEQLRKKPFFGGSVEPVSPLTHCRDGLEKSLLCAEKGIPVAVYGMPIAGVTAPCSLPSPIVIANAEILSQLVILQLKNPGTPVIVGAIPTIMDMRSTVVSYGNPEMSVMLGALTELCHYYELPVFGTAGATDAATIGVQAAVETTYQIIISALTGADFVHDPGLFYNATTLSQELIVLCDEVIDMVKVLIRGMEINDETLPLEIIERVGPRNSYIAEQHTYRHFSEIWLPKLFDRSSKKKDNAKRCEDLIKERTIELIKTHKPKPMSEDLVRELKKIEKSWFDNGGIKYEYPTRPEI